MLLRKLSYCVLLFVLFLVIGCGGGKEEGTPQPPAPAKKPAANAFDASKATAVITGKILFEGAKPNLAKLQMSADSACEQAHTSPVMEQTVQVNDDGTLKDVFVYVKEGADQWTYKTPAEPVALDQHGCIYNPHVMGMMVGQKLKITNSDPTLHNIHPMPIVNAEFNLGQPQGVVHEKSFDKPEVMIPVKCDVHRWMQSFIGVLSHPFYSVSGADGAYTMRVPAGTYTIEAWHEKFGTQTQSVTVADNETKEVPFTFKAM